MLINIGPDILGGTPVFAGTRVPIKNLFDCLEAGQRIDYFLDDFDGVQREQVLRVLTMSQQLIENANESGGLTRRAGPRPNVKRPLQTQV